MNISPQTIKTRKPPSSWPSAARDSYDAIRPIGVGGFGSVWLAKKKDDKVSPGDAFVAIKVVGKPKSETMSDFERRSQGGYFHREIAVLRELSHPNIVRILDSIEDKKDDTVTWSPYCMILSYCRGPTMEQLIDYGGALGIHMAKEISYQLIDVVSYLNGHAVIHRDIKPDNMIITGAKLDDDSCWSNDPDGVEAAKAKRWKMFLIDFGFARPLHPDEVDPKRNFVDATKPEPDDGFFGRSTVDDVREDSIHQIDGLNRSLSNSISHNCIRNLSAVGNRNYAAPEVTSKIKKFKDILNTSRGKIFERKKAPLAECVSDYGMIADAYSIGTTIRHMVTGIPPSISVEDFFSMKNNPLRLMGKQMKKVFPTKKNEKPKRKKRYCSNADLPKPAIRLILGLTHWNQTKRTTVREARTYEWIASSFSAKEDQYDKASYTGQGLKYLKCAYD